jgi:tRNA-specific 2-thiouridylase
MLAFAERIGAAQLATGHYARVVERGGSTLLARAADPSKDQSYMLGRLDPIHLDRLWFPLGDQTKDETRSEAARAGLAAARRAESQEACFLAGGDYRSFLERRGLNGDGAIVDERGEELGRHRGVWRFTPGQRRGLGVASSEPLYALRTDPATSTVVVGPRRSLAVRTVHARGRLHVPAERVEAKLRYRSPAVAATVSVDERGFTLDLDEPAYAVAPGQAAVLYQDDAVVGSGVIASTGP